MDASTKALLRARMKEAAAKREKKIDSPLVRYNDIGQPVCKVCNVAVKSEVLWTAHITSRQHKDAVEDMKVRAKALGVSNIKSSTPTTNSVPVPPKDSTNSLQVSPSGQPTSALPPDFFDDHNSKRVRTEVNTQVAAGPISPGDILPATAGPTVIDGSINEKREAVSDATAPKLENSKDPVSDKSSSLGSLPEGFFDNVDADHKARGLELPKHDIQDEYKEFQKLIQEDLKEVEYREEEEEFEAAEDREEREQLQQRELLEKIEMFKKKAEEKKNKAVNIDVTDEADRNLKQEHEADAESSSNEEADSEEDENADDLFLDWRAKRLWSSQSLT